MWRGPTMNILSTTIIIGTFANCTIFCCRTFSSTGTLVMFKVTFPSLSCSWIGMGDILSVILMTIHDEVDSFWCFQLLMDVMASNFHKDQVGINRQLEQLRKLLAYLFLSFHLIVLGSLIPNYLTILKRMSVETSSSRIDGSYLPSSANFLMMTFLFSRLYLTFRF